MYKYKCRICGYIQPSNDPPQIIHVCKCCGRVDIPLYAIDLYDCNDIPYVIRILKEEQQRRTYNDGIGIIYYWMTREGKVIEISKMTSSHLENTIKMLERKIEREESDAKENSKNKR